MTDSKILVAEDDPVLRRVIAYTLEMTGLAVDTVADGKLAQQKLAAEQYDLLVTDHQMPLCSGIELIAILRNTPEYKTLPIILCTARGLELDKELLRTKYHLAEIMHKPFSPRQLSQHVQRLLTQQSIAFAEG